MRQLPEALPRPVSWDMRRAEYLMPDGTWMDDRVPELRRWELPLEYMRHCAKLRAEELARFEVFCEQLFPSVFAKVIH